MKDPVDHILRPRLPWRNDTGAVTECGLNADKVGTMTRDEFFQRVKDYGQQRTAMLTCMTCSTTAQRWGSWDDDPRPALQREIEWERLRGHGTRLRDELQAIEALIKAHYDEFSDAVSKIAQQRDWNERKAALAARSTPLTKRF